MAYCHCQLVSPFYGELWSYASLISLEFIVVKPCKESRQCPLLWICCRQLRKTCQICKQTLQLESLSLSRSGWMKRCTRKVPCMPVETSSWLRPQVDLWTSPSFWPTWRTSTAACTSWADSHRIWLRSNDIILGPSLSVDFCGFWVVSPLFSPVCAEQQLDLYEYYQLVCILSQTLQFSVYIYHDHLHLQMILYCWLQWSQLPPIGTKWLFVHWQDCSLEKRLATWDFRN